MYSVDDLLNRATAEKAELKLRVGQPPIIVLGGEQRMAEGPEVTFEDAEQFLLSLANSRQRRIFRTKGWLLFFHEHRRQRFLVLVKFVEEHIEFDIQ